MAESNGKAPGMSWLSPYLIVKDGDAALAFYRDAFGFAEKLVMRDGDGAIQHAEMSYQGAVIMLSPEAPRHSYKAPATMGLELPVSMYVYCDDVDALYERAVAAGATGGQAPTDMPWGDRYAKLTDPDGHVWWFATHIGQPVAAAG